jgi:hypothetical protein
MWTDPLACVKGAAVALLPTIAIWSAIFKVVRWTLTITMWNHF